MTTKLAQQQSQILTWLKTLFPQQGYINVEENKSLIDAGLIAVDEDVVDKETGNIAALITADGESALRNGIEVIQVVEEDKASEPEIIEPVAEESTTPIKEEYSKKKDDFAIHQGGTPPKKERRKKESKYPFDDLAVGQLFFVAATKNKPNPAKSMASTVAGASKRYATITGKKTIKWRNQERTAPLYKYERKFSITSIKAGQTCGDFTADVDGAIILRIDLTENS